MHPSQDRIVSSLSELDYSPAPFLFILSDHFICFDYCRPFERGCRGSRRQLVCRSICPKCKGPLVECEAFCHASVSHAVGGASHSPVCSASYCLSIAPELRKSPWEARYSTRWWTWLSAGVPVLKLNTPRLSLGDLCQSSSFL